MRQPSVSHANKKHPPSYLWVIPKQLPEIPQKATAAAGLSSRGKIYIRDSRKKKKPPHKTPLMKTILLTDVSSALDFSHTVSKDKYTSKHMNNTIQKRRLGGGGVHDTYTNLLENPREKTKCTVAWFFVAIIKYIFIDWLIQSLWYREQSGLWL